MQQIEGKSGQASWNWRGTSPWLVTFVIFVLLPPIVVSSYQITAASPEYISEAKFVVRASGETSRVVEDGIPTSALLRTPSTAQPASSNLSSSSRFGTTGVLSPGGFQTVNQDAFIVAEYIRSRHIIDDVGGKDLLVAMYGRPEIDWLSRLRANLSLEELQAYWGKKVIVSIDTISGIVTLRARAFNAADAQALAEKIIKSSETLVNKISERARSEALQRAESELALSQNKLNATQQALLSFRNSSRIVDPSAQAASTGGLIAELIKDRMSLEGARSVIRDMASADNPSSRQLNAQIDALNVQIGNLQKELADPDERQAIASQVSVYEGLQLQRQLAETLYAINKNAYEEARRAAERQWLYVMTVSRPTLAQEAYYPRRLLDTAMVFCVSLILWSMGALLIASVKDHIE